MTLFRRFHGGDRRSAAVATTTPGDAGNAPEQAILRALDRAAADFRFPTLNNGYVYPAATRLSAYRADAGDWALVVELFGFSPRAGFPDLSTSPSPVVFTPAGRAKSSSTTTRSNT